MKIVNELRYFHLFFNLIKAPFGGAGSLDLLTLLFLSRIVKPFIHIFLIKLIFEDFVIRY